MGVLTVWLGLIDFLAGQALLFASGWQESLGLPVLRMRGDTGDRHLDLAIVRLPALSTGCAAF
jgi:hypothetical protein